MTGLLRPGDTYRYPIAWASSVTSVTVASYRRNGTTATSPTLTLTPSLPQTLFDVSFVISSGFSSGDELSMTLAIATASATTYVTLPAIKLEAANTGLPGVDSFGSLTSVNVSYIDSNAPAAFFSSQTIASVTNPVTLTAAYNAAKTAAQAGDAMGLTTGAITASKIAASALNGKGDWMVSGATVVLDANQPNYAPAKAGDQMALVAGAIQASKIAMGALNGAGDWMLSGTKVVLAAAQTDYVPSKAGDPMTLTGAYDRAKSAASPGEVSPTINFSPTIDGGFGDSDRTRLQATASEANATTNRTQILSAIADIDVGGGGGDGVGTGDVAVDHSFGGTDALRYVDPDGFGIDGATVKAYLASDYDAAPPAYRVRGQTATKSDGRWVAPLQLDPATAYVIVVEKVGMDTAAIARITTGGL